MSIVPEEGSLTPSDIQQGPKSPSPQPAPKLPKSSNSNGTSNGNGAHINRINGAPIATPRKRTTDTLANIKNVGNLMTSAASVDQINKISSLPRSGIMNDSQHRKSQPILTSFRSSASGKQSLMK